MKNLLFSTLITFLGVFSLNAQSIAHVDRDIVIDTLPSQANAAAEIESFRKRAFEELRETQQKLQGDFRKLEEERDRMSPTAFKFEENRLNKKAQEFQERQMELEQQIQVITQEAYMPIMERIDKAIEKVAKAEKVDYIIDSSDPSFLYTGGRDLTNKVVQEALKFENEAAAAAGGQ